MGASLIAAGLRAAAASAVGKKLISNAGLTTGSPLESSKTRIIEELSRPGTKGYNKVASQLGKKVEEVTERATGKKNFDPQYSKSADNAKSPLYNRMTRNVQAVSALKGILPAPAPKPPTNPPPIAPTGPKGAPNAAPPTAPAQPAPARKTFLTGRLLATRLR